MSAFAAFFLGLILGAGGCLYLCELRRRKYLRETAEGMRRSGMIQDDFHATSSMILRGVLQHLESSEIEAAKQKLSTSIAIFYQTQCEQRTDLTTIGIKPSHPDWIGRELRAIEGDAKRFECLRVALAEKQNQPGV